MRIHLVLSDDWELRGNGSGDMRQIQFAPLDRLLSIYETCGLRASINAEILQQLSHRTHGADVPALGALADEWEEAVKGAYSRGHDVQLHLHPQWTQATYEAGWALNGSWQLPDYPQAEVLAMLGAAKQYLETLLKPIDPDYRCVTFRGGGWSFAPAEHILPALAQLGFVADLSIADGLYYSGPHVWLDYRGIEEPFLPFYPAPGDARKVATDVQPVVCVPTHTFRMDAPMRLSPNRDVIRPPMRFRYRLGSGVASKLNRFGRLRDSFMLEPYRTANDGPGPAASYAQEHWPASVVPVTQVVSDLSALSWAGMREMLRDIRQRAARVDAEAIPVVLENHTKDIRYFRPVERLARALEAEPDIEVITLADMARNIAIGTYPIRRAGA